MNIFLKPFQALDGATLSPNSFSGPLGKSLEDVYQNGVLPSSQSLQVLNLNFISTFILLTRWKATEALIHRISNYPNLLQERPKYCSPLEIL